MINKNLNCSTVLNSSLKIYGASNGAQHEESARLGLAVMLLAKIPSRGNTSIRVFARTILEAIRQHNIKFYYDCDGIAVAYALWAYLEPATETRILTKHSTVLEPDEWNAGSSLWIIDLIAPLGNLLYVLDDLRDNVFKEEQAVRYLRHKNGRFIAKEISRDSHCHFFRAPTKRIPGCECGHPECPGMN